MLKLIKIILGIALVAVAAYFLFIKDSAWASKTSNLDLSGQGVMTLASTTGQSVKNQVQGTFYKIVSEIKSRAEGIAVSAVQQAKNYVFGFFKKAVENEVNKLGESVGANPNSSATSTLP